MNKYKVAVAGTGYVGLSLSVLLAQKQKVVAIDIDSEKVNKINARISPIDDDYIIKYLKESQLDLTATLDPYEAYSDADFVIVATPTNYDPNTQYFDTSAVESVIQLVMKINPEAASTKRVFKYLLPGVILPE